MKYPVQESLTSLLSALAGMNSLTSFGPGRDYYNPDQIQVGQRTGATTRHADCDHAEIHPAVPMPEGQACGGIFKRVGALQL